MLILARLVAYDEADFSLMGMFMEHHAADIRYDIGDENNSPEWTGYVPPYPWFSFPKHNGGDYILIPSAEKFLSRADHFSILLHEFIHWAEVRTGWMHNMAAREFVAEAGMHILGQELGVPHTPIETNHFKWLPGWNELSLRDERFFIWAMAQVDRACDFLLKPILGRRQEFYHDPCWVLPEIRHGDG